MLLVVTNAIALLCSGFRLESLLKLADCRGSSDCKNLLHFILRQLLQNTPEIENLSSELVTVQAAAKLQVCFSCLPNTYSTAWSGWISKL